MRCSREALDLDIEFVGFDFVEKTRLSMSFKVHFQRWDVFYVRVFRGAPMVA